MAKHKIPLWRKWLYCLLPAGIAVALYLVLPHVPDFTEQVFSRGIFRVISRPLTWLVSVLPFSLTEMAVILGIPAVLAAVGIWIYRLIRRENRRQIAERGVRLVAAVLSCGLLLFMLMDGVNFSRPAVGELMHLKNGEYDVAFLAAVTADLAQKTSAARKAVEEDENGCMRLRETPRTTLLLVDDCYRNLQAQYPFLQTGTWRVKSVALSHLWSYTGYTGVYCPWLGEASINTDIPHSEWGHTAAHELAHTMGFAREDACNFLAFLACTTSELPDFVYSGYLSAYIYCSNALYTYDKAAYREAAALCSDAVRRDLRQRNAYWQPFFGKVMDTSQDFNDAFIKANGVESGIASYDEVVTLILRYYDTRECLHLQ